MLLLAATALAACGAEAADDASQLAVTTNPEVAALLGTPLTDSDVEAESKAIHERAEAAIAICMAAQGFEYIPVAFDLVSAVGLQTTDSSFGVADQFFATFSEAGPTEVENPNLAVLRVLTLDEQAAYGAALNGAAASFDPRFDSLDTVQDALREGTENPTGCRESATAEAIAETDRNPVLIDEYQQLRAGVIATDQRMVRAQFEWVQCMSKAGFPYNDTGAIREDIAREALAVIDDLGERGIELEPGSAAPPEAVELIDAVYAREQDAAEAHANCRGPVDEAIEAVEEDVDRIFLDRNA